MEPSPQRPHPLSVERFACDFCGDEAVAVRRVALDADYERLRTPHQERYSCEACFHRKERQRLGLERG
jgi:hypothetical protein